MESLFHPGQERCFQFQTWTKPTKWCCTAISLGHVHIWSIQCVVITRRRLQRELAAEIEILICVKRTVIFRRSNWLEREKWSTTEGSPLNPKNFQLIREFRVYFNSFNRKFWLNRKWFLNAMKLQPIRPICTPAVIILSKQLIPRGTSHPFSIACKPAHLQNVVMTTCTLMGELRWLEGCWAMLERSVDMWTIIHSLQRCITVWLCNNNITKIKSQNFNVVL